MSPSAHRFGPLAISLTFVVLSGLWILLSDRLVLAVSGGDPAVLTSLSIAKGWAFVGGTGALLYGLVHRRERVSTAQRQLLTSVLDNIGDSVIVVDPTGRVTAMNPTAGLLFGAARVVADLKGWCTADGKAPLPTEDLPFARGLRGETTDGALVFVRNRRLPAGGCFSVTARPLFDRADALTGVVVVLHDVTVARLAEERLRASEHLFHSVARLAPVGIFRCDGDGACLYVNERWCELSGLTPEMALGGGWIAAVHPDDRAAVAAEWQRAVNGRVPFRMEYRFLRADGHAAWVLGEAVEELNREGEAVACVGTVTDITARKATDDQTRQLAEELERRVGERTAQLQASSRELDAFSYSVSHDLRAPLRAISAFSQMALQESEGVLPGTARAHLLRVIAASRRMGEVIDGLLGLARVTRSELRGEWVDVTALGEAIVEELRAESPSHEVEATVAPGLRLWGDPVLLRIALENLLRNAWKFTRDTPRAAVWVEATPGEAAGVVVRDNGAGFDMAWAGKLFRAFERLHTADEFPGSGIGLATVHRIVIRHGGRVWAEGTVGGGAHFAFTVADGPTEVDE